MLLWRQLCDLSLGLELRCVLDQQKQVCRPPGSVVFDSADRFMQPASERREWGHIKNLRRTRLSPSWSKHKQEVTANKWMKDLTEQWRCRDSGLRSLGGRRARQQEFFIWIIDVLLVSIIVLMRRDSKIMLSRAWSSVDILSCDLPPQVTLQPFQVVRTGKNALTLLVEWVFLYSLCS